MQAPQVFKYFDKIDLTPFKEMLNEAQQLQDNLNFPQFPSSWWQLFQDLPESGPYFLIVNNLIELITDGYENPPAELVIEGSDAYKTVTNTSTTQTYYAYVEGGTVKIRNKTYNIGSKSIVKILPQQTYIFENATIHAWYDQEPIVSYTFKLPWKYVRVLTDGWEQTLTTIISPSDIRSGVFWARNQDLIDSVELQAGDIGYQLLGTPSEDDTEVWTFFNSEKYVSGATLPDGSTAPAFVYGLTKVHKNLAEDAKQWRDIVPLSEMQTYTVSDAQQYSKSFQVTIQKNGSNNVHLVEIDVSNYTGQLTIQDASTDYNVIGYYLFTINEIPQECRTVDELKYANIIIGDIPFYSTFEFGRVDGKLSLRKQQDTQNNLTIFDLFVTPEKQYSNMYAVVWTSCPASSESSSDFNVDATGYSEILLITPRTIPNAMLIDNAHAFCEETIKVYDYKVKEAGEVSFALKSDMEVAVLLKETESSLGSNVKIPADFTVTYDPGTGTETETSSGDVLNISVDSYEVNPPASYKAVVYRPAQIKLEMRLGDVVTDIGTPIRYDRRM